MEKNCKNCIRGGTATWMYPCNVCLAAPPSDVPEKWEPTADRVNEIMQAEREGRLVILPCKRGETVWCLVRDRSVVWPDESRRKIITRTFDLDDVFEVGKTVFLTREEAEKALEEVKCD